MCVVEREGTECFCLWLCFVYCHMYRREESTAVAVVLEDIPLIMIFFSFWLDLMCTD